MFPGVTSRVVGGMGRYEVLVFYPMTIVPIRYTTYAKALYLYGPYASNRLWTISVFNEHTHDVTFVVVQK